MIRTFLLEKDNIIISAQIRHVRLLMADASILVGI